MKFFPRNKDKHIKILNAVGFNISYQDLDKILDLLDHMPVRIGGGLWIQYKELLTKLILSHKQPFNSVDDYPMIFKEIINVMIEQLERQDDLIEKLADYANKLFSPEFPSCGNNSDWGLPAWYVGINEPNEENGDCYILSLGDGKYTLTKKTYLGDGDDRQLDLISIDLSQAQTIEEGMGMLDLLSHTGTYIVHNL